MPPFFDLIVTGYLLTIAFVLLIFIPWWRGRTDLISYWSLFLFGSLNFIALGMIVTPAGFNPVLAAWSSRYAAATILFYAIFVVVYLWPIRSAIEVRPRWMVWPSTQPYALMVIAVALSVCGLLASAAPAVQGAQIIFILRGPLAIAGFATALVLCLRNPRNLIFWGVAVFCFAIGVYSVLTWGTGRRELLALFLALPGVGYWAYFRYKPKRPTLVGLLVLGLAGAVVVTSYQSFRHEDREASSTQSRVIERVQKFPEAISSTVTNWKWFGEAGAAFDTQNAIFAGLQTMRQIDNGKLERHWFHTPMYIVANPIPRAVWPSKPSGLGQILPQSTGEYVVTWGPTIVGHAWYDGGWAVLVLYALVLGRFVRFLDLQLCADPTNPWPYILLCAASGHVIGFARGDCGGFAVQVLGVLVLIPLLLTFLRYFTGNRTPFEGISDLRGPVGRPSRVV